MTGSFMFTSRLSILCLSFEVMEVRGGYAQGQSQDFDLGGVDLRIWNPVYILFSNFNRWSNLIIYWEIWTRRADIPIMFLIMSLISKALATWAKLWGTFLQYQWGLSPPWLCPWLCLIGQNTVHMVANLFERTHIIKMATLEWNFVLL